MATKSKAQHLGNREDYQDAAAYLEDFGTLEGWEAPVGATYKTGEELMDFWKSAGVDKNNDGKLSAEEMKPQMDATLAYWNAKPKRSKMNAISEEVRRTMPYVAAVAPFAAPGSVLGGIAKGTSSLGKWGQLLTGGGKFAKNPLVNAAIKQAISKAAGGAGMDTLGNVMKYGAVGHGAADMFNKGIYAPQKIMQGEHDMINSKLEQMKQGGSKWTVGGLKDQKPDKYSLGGLDDPQAGNQWGLGKELDSLPQLGSDNEILKEIYNLQKYGFNPGAQGHGGAGYSTVPPNMPGGTRPPSGYGSGSGGAGGGSAKGSGAQNLLAMGLLTGMLGKAFEGDNKPSPAPSGGGGGTQYGGMPTYGNLVGFATTSDAIEDQKNRLKYGRRVG